MAKKYVTAFKIIWITLLWGSFIATIILGKFDALVLRLLATILGTILTMQLY